MPANLTPQYLKAEEEYRKAQSAAERLVCLETMFRVIPKHKGTDKLQADLKHRMAEARAEVTAEKSAPKTGARSYRIPHQGAGQAILLGGPNSGKSRLLASLTNAKPEVAAYPFTTREPMPGMMKWQDVFVQLVDTPPVTDQHLEGYLPGLVRAADLVLLCFDGSSDDAPDQTAAVIKKFADRKTLLDSHSGFAEEDYSVVHIKSLLIVTHGRDHGVYDRLDFFAEIVPTRYAIHTIELDDTSQVAALGGTVYAALGVMRVYTKPPGKKADMAAPFSLPIGGTVEDLANRVHKELAAKLKFAKLWGAGVHDGQSVGPEHVLADGDVVELHS